MKKIYTFLLTMLLLILASSNLIYAQQVPNANFEDWSGEEYDGEIQPKGWNASNVTQEVLGTAMRFNFAHQESGHTGSHSLMVQDTEVGAAGITETSPGYFALGKPWTYLEGLSVGTATAGTAGGINWTYRPDTMSVWIKRTGSNTDKEDFYLLYYAWSGTAKASKYKNKNNGCTSVSQTNEESDIRLALNANECGTDQKATQIAEGMWRERKTYGEWTNIRVPIYYMNDEVPTMMNMIFSASNYPNFRANDGLYVGNSLYVDDVELIYSSKIDKLYIGGKEWKGFDPNFTEEQNYSLGRTTTEIPAIKAVRGAGSLTNARGNTVVFSGRELRSNEMTITSGTIDGNPTIITVSSEDGKSTTTYKIKFVREASTNAKLSNIFVNGSAISNFQPAIYNYTVELPYGTTAIPTISAEAQEDEQTINITQPTSITGTASITVTAADKKTTATYTIQFKVAQLSDNTLKDIKINGTSLAGFSPNQYTYHVSLPTTTTSMPIVEAISAYAEGEQTIKHTTPAVIDGGTYQISVSTPGSPTPKIYKLNFKLEASSYALLKSLQMGDNLITDFDPNRTTYYVNLPIGTTEFPTITYEKGEPTQQVLVEEGGLNGVSKVLVTAGNGINTTEYKIVVSTALSEISSLHMIYIGGEALADFAPEKTSYSYTLPIGTTLLPAITVDKGDEYQTVNIITGGINGTTRITVIAQNGNTTVYQIAFSVGKATDATLKMIYLDGQPLDGFDPNILEYDCPLPKGTTQLPIITYDQSDEYQTITTRDGGINGDYKITVRPQSGASQTYVLHFSVETSDNASLNNIYIDGKALENFYPDTLHYTITLPMGITTIPTVTYEKAEESQKVLNILSGNVQTIKVTAESGNTRTYIITFIIQRSESAFLKMIYLNGDSLIGFDQKVFDYTVPLSSSTCPIITVDKEEGQQITISTPHAAGQAKIVVQPEFASANTYTIDFIDADNNFALLRNIYIDDQAIPGFLPNQFTYSVVCQHTTPTITYDSDSTQIVTIFRQRNIVTIYVVAGEHKAQYEIILNLQANTDCTLRDIAINGNSIPGFDPQQHTYTLDIANDITPNISFEKQYAEQVVHTGMQNANTYNLFVQAQSGDTTTYTLFFKRLLDDDANLIDLQLEGMDFDFEPTTYNYTLSLPDGYKLPAISVESKPGQNIVLHNINDTKQEVIVIAPSGRTQVYTIHYKRNKSVNAYLSDILLNGISLQGFDTQVLSYTDSLAQGTKLVPCVQPIGMHPDQTITTYHSAIDGVTTIHVVAPDGQTTQDYAIHFPVKKSSNVALEYIMLDHDKVSLTYIPDVTDYTIHMPYGEKNAPLVLYQALEPEQTIAFISRPLGQTSQIIVTAENGDQRTYNIHFLPTYANETNLLATLGIEEMGVSLDASQTEHTVVLPYGTRTMTVNYTKAFAEQTIWVQPGGVTAPTIITVKSNRPGEEDVIYTLTPAVDTQDPAVLTDIKVNGTTIEGFDANRFSYIANITQNPVIQYTPATGAMVNVTIQTNKHWQAQVTYQGRTNTYDVWYYYQNDQVPNTDFTEWTNCATYTSAVKPTGWNTIADVLGKHSGFGTFNPDGMVSKSGNDAVYLKTPYSTPGGGNIPGFITLGTVSGKWGVAGTSSFSVSGGITFHNTPDQLTIRYYNSKVTNNSLIQYTLTGLNGTKTFNWTDSETGSNYKEVTKDLTEANTTVGDPSLLNITLCSYNTTDGTTGSLSTAAEMYVDWLRFAYNSTLTGLTVNDSVATMDGNAFSYTLTDPENTLLPTLTFIGEVADQAQHVAWGDTTIIERYSVRNATITNYAEDGTSTQYTLTLRRPLDINNLLSDLRVNGQTIATFVNTKTAYEVHLPSTTKHLPDVQPVAGSSLQTIATQYADSTLTITVSPELGEVTTYTIRFITDLSNDTQLENITAEGISFDPAQTEYTIDADKLPVITFVKKMDGQTVELHDGVITVIAEDGTQATYTILLNRSDIHTTGQLAEIEINGIAMQEFDRSTYEYTHPKPERVGFTRVHPSDSVIFIQTPSYMEWQVFGDEQHTYRIAYPQAQSSNTDLKAIYINSSHYEAFTPSVHEYTYYTDEPVHIHVVANDQAAQLAATYHTQGDTIIYTYTVTAADGTIGQPYTLIIAPNLSSSPYLQAIYMDGILLEDFQTEVLQYTYTIPTGAYKVAEPAMPSIHYELGASRQQVTIEHGNIGETTNIIVTSEDGINQAIYQMLVKAEHSHCTSLTGIAVNGKPIENFVSHRHYYSVKTTTSDVTLTWSSNDNFQTVTQSFDGFAYTLHVLAQDGITTSDYIIEVYNDAASNDITLAQILLDGLTLDKFHPALNPGLAFSAMQQRYTINLPSGTQYLPEITARLNSKGQSVVINTDQWTTQIIVTAADGITTNTYTLQFLAPKSSNTHLKMIYLDGEPLATFTPDHYHYFIPLPVGQTTMPDVYAVPQESTQIILDSITGSLQHTIFVTAENGVQDQYLLVFQLTPSEADTLQAIYEDGVLIDGFRPDSFYYAYTLPIGTTFFPKLTWDEADKWQTITTNNVVDDTIQRITQIHVQAMSGSKNTYTVAYNVEQSNVDTLQMIFIQSDSLEGFDPYTHDYYLYLSAGDSIAPTITWVEGDAYQIVNTLCVPYLIANKQIGWKQVLEVQAQNGQTRIYTIYFMFSNVLSDNANLLNIYINGIPLEGFTPTNYHYTFPLTEEEPLPSVLAEKAEPQQRINIDMGDITRITVMAEDTTYQSTYTITFQRQLSSNCHLEAIYQDGVLIDGFRPDSFYYDIVLPYGTITVPTFTYEVGHTLQTVAIDTFVVALEEQTQTTFRFSVTAPDPMYSAEYDVRVTTALNDDCSLQSLAVKGQIVEGFHPDSTNYVLTYPIGTDSIELAALSDIQAIANDTNASVSITADGVNFTIQVSAQDGQHVRVYTLEQVVQLSSNARLSAIYLDSTLIRDFNSETLEYTYYIVNSQPTVQAIPEDGNAMVDYSMYTENEPFYIYVTAADGTELIYTIHFLRTTIESAQTPMATDVLVKHIAGTCELVFATLRKNVSVGIYTLDGSLLYMSKLEETSQNDAYIVTDANGADKLVDIYTYHNVFTLPEANKTYIYAFFENGKRCITSGKILLAK